MVQDSRVQLIGINRFMRHAQDSRRGPRPGATVEPRSGTRRKACVSRHLTFGQLLEVARGREELLVGALLRDPSPDEHDDAIGRLDGR